MAGVDRAASVPSSAADSIGVPFDRTVNNRLRGVSRMASLDIILEQSPCPFSQAEKDALADQKNELYKQFLAEMTPADLPSEVKETLDTLRKMGYLLAIGSSSKNTPFILQQIGLAGFFDAISDGNSITHSKPDPEVFVKSAQMLRTYWGGMANEGADTFWELYNPDNPNESPYGGTIVLSYCHAWSCAPAYFLRRYYQE